MLTPEPEGKQYSLPNPRKIPPEGYLQTENQILQTENQILQTEVLKLREEVDRLKTRLGVIQGCAIAVTKACHLIKGASISSVSDLWRQLIAAIDNLERALWG